jgi:CHAT domain-containing protein/tetratricopeptide (TPR) repeat protein
MFVNRCAWHLFRSDNRDLNRVLGLALFATSIVAAESHLDIGIDLQRGGKLKAADLELRAAITDLTAAGNQRDLLKALSIESWISVSLGNYSDAIQQSTQAVQLRRSIRDQTHIADDLNTRALANQNLGKYAVALDDLELALRADRAVNDAEGEITRLTNIGNVYYFQGRYSDALRLYQRAKSKLDATLAEPWNPRRRQVTLANIAAVDQIVGKEEEALELYKGMAAASQSMPARERAQLLANQGALYRRLGDPVKALELYRAAKELYRADHYSDGEIGVLRNEGTARLKDLADPDGALAVFSEALKLGRDSSNRRAAIQASFYRSETLRVLRRLKEAEADAQYAIEGAKSSGLVDEQWRSLYVLGRIAEEEGRRDAARNDYTEAVSVIESIRTSIHAASLRGEFLADKRDVYDALIDLRVRDGAPVDEVFRLIEHSRARALNDRMSLGTLGDLHIIQSHLGPRSLLVDIWAGTDSVAIVWISSSRAGYIRHACHIQDEAERLVSALQAGSEQWRDESRLLGDLLLQGIPSAPQIVIVPDGPLSLIPFELIAEPQSRSLLIELSEISYLPSAQFLVRKQAPNSVLLPWQRQMLALGDPPVSNSDVLNPGWRRLQFSGTEIRSIERVLRGRSEIHIGADAQKHYIQGGQLENLPVLHFSTHALVDPENPERSRILLASDYIFEGEVYDLNLKGVDLVTVSACDTARGKLVRGEGVQAFSRAFLAAGANSTVTSLWRVADEPTATFMNQFYYFLAKGQSKATALRSAKLELLRSNSALAHPRYWAAFIVTGDGFTELRRPITWGTVLLVAAGFVGVIALIAHKMIRAARPMRQTEAKWTESRPR